MNPRPHERQVGDPKHIGLADEEPNTLESFVEYIYRRQLLPPVLAETEEGETEGEPEPKKRKREARGGHYPAKKLIDWYIFADMRQCLQLECAAMDAYHYCITELWKDPTQGLLSLIHESAPPNCGMRRLVVDWFAKSGNPRVQAEKDVFWGSATVEEEIPKLEASRDFLLELAIAMFKVRAEARPIRTQEG